MSPVTNSDLADLKRLAEDGRRVTLPGTEFAILWGLLVVLASGLTYLAIGGAVALPVWSIWTGFIVLGWAGSMILGRRLGRNPKAPALANRLLAAIWIATGAGITACYIGIVMSGGVYGQLMIPISHAALGTAFAVIANLSRERWLYGVALAWWASVIAAFQLLDRIEVLLLTSGAALVLLVLPALVLARKARRD